MAMHSSRQLSTLHIGAVHTDFRKQHCGGGPHSRPTSCRSNCTKGYNSGLLAKGSTLRCPLVRAAASDIQPSGSRPSQLKQSQGPQPALNSSYNGVFSLLLINFLLYTADKLLHLPWATTLYLHHSNPRWWQFLSAAFCHASWQHISGNAFMLLIFGRIVEEEEGTFGVLATYIFCALGASIASYLLQPRQVVSLGASGAVFGLFVVSVLCKLSFNPRKLLECAILGQFVMQQVLHEAKMQIGSRGTAIAGTRVGHLAHLFGALAGVLLVFLLSRIPAPADD